MGISNAHYYGWQGKLKSPWYAILAIVRVGLLQVFRRKSYWLVIALGVFHFLLYWSIIYVLTQARLPLEAQKDIFQWFGFNPKTESGGELGYIRFMQQQSAVVMILLAFSGSLLVGSDFHMKSMPFYLSKRIDRRHYIIGKLLAISVIVSLLTTIPALLLFVEFGILTSSIEYWKEHWDVVPSVLAYGLALCVVLSIPLMTISAYLQRMAPIAITWATIFVMFGRLGSFLSDATDNDNWRLIDPWIDVRLIGKLCFGAFSGSSEHEQAVNAALLLGTICELCLLALVRRVRAVDITE
ncbi:MAG TPA: ABC transporter permease subunit [Pirellulales bacterium]|jgi:ABC-type transport system involved in multi-copper enzyme maturation permease subunit